MGTDWLEVQVATWGLRMASDVGQSCGSQPITVGLCQLQAVLELNDIVGHPVGAWKIRELIGVREKTHIFAVRSIVSKKKYKYEYT